IINQDGTLWLDAIRNGVREMDLGSYVDRIEITNIVSGGAAQNFTTFANTAEVIGLLTTQASLPDLEARAYLWVISGSAAEKEPNRNNRDFSFKYRMTVHIEH